MAIRLAERTRVVELEPGERRTTDDMVWVVARGSLAILAKEADATVSVSSFNRRATVALPGHVIGLIRIVAPATPPVSAVAAQATTLLALGADDMRDVLEEDPAALAAITSALARILLEGAP